MDYINFCNVLENHHVYTENKELYHRRKSGLIEKGINSVESNCREWGCLSGQPRCDRGYKFVLLRAA